MILLKLNRTVHTRANPPDTPIVFLNQYWKEYWIYFIPSKPCLDVFKTNIEKYNEYMENFKGT